MDKFEEIQRMPSVSSTVIDDTGHIVVKFFGFKATVIDDGDLVILMNQENYQQISISYEQLLLLLK